MGDSEPWERLVTEKLFMTLVKDGEADIIQDHR